MILALAAAAFLLSAVRCDAQIFHRRKKVNKSTSADNSAQPDKILYNKALDDIKHGRHEVGRLNMQTLINTYPDSEFLAKAKLAIADSYYKEGGSANMAQAIAGYKDFIVFFPFLPEARYAQMQVAMAHYRQMEKPDRDRTQARSAEAEFQTFLEKYPNDALSPMAEQRLREVQEVLAEGDYRIGYFYYVKGDKRAAAARLMSVTKRYPLYSKSDRALWMLGDIFESSEHKDIAALYYGQIVREYPLSKLANDAKDRLKDFKVPIPQPDPKAVAWMQAEEKSPRKHASILSLPMSLLRSGPREELQAAARTGTPNLQPEADTTSATDILTGGGQSQIAGRGATSGIVATVTPGTSTNSAGTAGEAENTAAPTDAHAPSPASTNDPNAVANTEGSTTTPAAGADGSGTSEAPKSDAAAGATQTSDATKAGDPPRSTANGTDKKDKKESSSKKKKKGLRKIVPW